MRWRLPDVRALTYSEFDELLKWAEKEKLLKREATSEVMG